MRYFKYFSAQLKRTLKLAVGVFPTAMLLFACLGAAAWLFFSSAWFTEKQEKYKIGVVGKIDETYLGFGIYAVQTLDSTRFMVDFIPMEEEEARAAFRNGDVIAYVTVPDEFLDSIIYGRNDVPLGYVVSEGQKGLEGYLMEELSVAVSNLVTSSQCSIYSMQEVARRLGETKDLRKWTDDFNLRLIGYVLGRTGLAELEELGLSKGLLVRQYYFCAIVLLFTFLFGITGAALFLGRNEGLGKWMKLRGIGPVMQVLCEFGCYYLLAFACVAIPLTILNLITGQMSFLNCRIWMDDLLKVTAVVTLLSSSMQFAIYETVKNPVANLLLQFIGILGMGYVSGYLYPASFFPEGIAHFGSILPTGVAFQRMSSSLFGVEEGRASALLLAYVGVFLVTSILVRKWRVLKEDR